MTSMVNSTLNKRKYSTPYMSNKRMKYTPRVYRTLAVKPEMKHIAFPITHATTTASNTDCSLVAQGTSNLQRVGNKIKIWNMQATLTTTQSIKVDMLLPVDASATLPTYAIATPPDRDELTQLGTYAINPQNGGNVQVAQISKKFPMGIVTKYTGSASTTCNKNKLVVRITSPVNATVTGYFQIWYTDAWNNKH